MSCECQSGQRVLRIRANDPTQPYPEFAELASPARWELVPEGPEGAGAPCIHVFVGGQANWDTIAEVVNFLRTVLTEARMAPLMGAWLPLGEGGAPAGKPSCTGTGTGTGAGCGGACGSADKPAGQEIREYPLTEMSPLDATPLVSILRERRIESWFQPVFRAGSHELWGYECLMRARQPDGTLIFPGTLLDWARQERLIFMLDRICRETHIANAAQALPPDVSVLINFLPTAIYDPGFCLRTTRAAAKRARLDPARVIFEVVETEQVSDLEHLRGILDHYRQGGFRTALDDVGAGYAGLTMLAELSPDLIKIDRELVRQAPGSKMHRIICNALSQIARQSGALCLAEGIETPEEYQTMLGVGVDLVQGYYFAKPALEPATTTPVSAVAHTKRRALKQAAA